MRPLEWVGRLLQDIHDSWVLRRAWKRSLKAGRKRAAEDGDL